MHAQHTMYRYMLHTGVSKRLKPYIPGFSVPVTLSFSVTSLPTPYRPIRAGSQREELMSSITVGVRARAGGGQTRAKPFFRAKANFFRAEAISQKTRKAIFWYLLNEKTEFILCSEIDLKRPITGWGKSGKVILQVSIAASFSGAVEKFLGQRWLSSPP